MNIAHGLAAAVGRCPPPGLLPIAAAAALMECTLED
jgi:hypothetical protein